MATVAVRFVFPAVSAEGSAFWIIRTSPISMHDFLWSKFWTALVPVLLFTEALTIAANQLLGVDPFLKVVAAGGIVVMTFALVGLATGLGARYPRFGADATQAAGSYGGVMFMILAVLLHHRHHRAAWLVLVDVHDVEDRPGPIPADARSARRSSSRASAPWSRSGSGHGGWRCDQACARSTRCGNDANLAKPSPSR